MARLREQGQLVGHQARLLPLGNRTVAAKATPRQQPRKPRAERDDEGDLLRGVDPRSREATLLREAEAMRWIGFYSFDQPSKKGRWYTTGVHPKGDHIHGPTAKSALDTAWNHRTKNSRHPVLDAGGPWTWKEQHERVEAEAKRLRKRYAALGLPRPRQPAPALHELRMREAQGRAHLEREQGMTPKEVNIRRNLREANAANAALQFVKDAQAFWDALPDADPDQTPYPGQRNGDALVWATDVMHARLRFPEVTSSRRDLQAFDATLNDDSLARDLDAPVLRLFQKRRDELAAAVRNAKVNA